MAPKREFEYDVKLDIEARVRQDVKAVLEVEGRKRHLLVDTEGLVLEARVHSTKVPDADGIRLLLEPVRARFGRLSHLLVEAGYQGRGKRCQDSLLNILATNATFMRRISRARS